MEERLLFNRVHRYGYRVAVYQRIKFPVPIFLDTANPLFAVADKATMVAQSTPDTAVAFGFPKHGFFRKDPPNRLHIRTKGAHPETRNIPNNISEGP